jgi:hypothetical protein
MPRVIARIIIDTDDWESAVAPASNHPVLVWRKVETSHAQPFTARELGQTAGMFSDLYFG